MSSEERISDLMLEQFQEKAPDLLGLAESFMEAADGRWYLQGVATGPGWWGEEDGFFLDTTVANPGYEHDTWIIYWIGRDHVRVRVLVGWREFGEWALDADYRMEHDDLRAYLGNLPRPLRSYGMEEVEAAPGGGTGCPNCG